jgi:hypothetical protein
MFHLAGVDERPVVLYFEADKLVRWVEIEEIEYGDAELSEWVAEWHREQLREMQRSKHIKDHEKGRKHHHGH